MVHNMEKITNLIVHKRRRYIEPGDFVKIAAMSTFYGTLNQLDTHPVIPTNVSTIGRSQLGLVLAIYGKFALLMIQDGRRGWFMELPLTRIGERRLF